MTDISGKDSVPISRRMAVKSKGGKWAPHAIRLRILRCAIFDETSSSFARRLDVGIQRLSNIENGYPLSIDIANKIRRLVPGITLDWLYHGSEAAVPFDLLMKLRKEADKPDYHPPA